MESLRDIQVFVAVAEHGSFAAAAEALAMSRPSVSRAVAALEDALGVQLLVRTTRVVTLSQVGRSYLDDSRRLLEMVATARASARGRHQVVEGTLSLTAPVVFGRLHVAPLLRTFLEGHPAVQADLALLDRVTHLEEEGFDLAVRIGRLDDTSQRAVRVGDVRRVVVASPAYVARHGSPDDVGDLEQHVLVARGSRWRFARGERTVQPRVRVSDVAAGIDLAVAGFGLAQMLSYQVGDRLRRGELVEVLAHRAPPPVPVHVVLPVRQRLPARTRAFVDHLVPGLRARAAQEWS